MPQAKFIQIHSLHGYSATLLNRDDSGLAKRISYGGTSRTRISSQCLKRHWRTNKDVHSLDNIEGSVAATRSREIVTRKVTQPLIDAGIHKEVANAIDKQFQIAIYGDKGAEKSSRQPLLLGKPEIDYLEREARRIADEHPSDAAKAEKAAEEWRKGSKENMKTLRESSKLPGGLVSALFGRMVTSDVEANLDAAIYVAHAFTVHAEDSESDYFTVVDDLHQIEDDAGADHIGETELSSGLYYGYVVIDRENLIKNLGGDSELAGEICKRLAGLIATVSPGAKLGSTAPFGYAGWMLAEAGHRQPRSLAEAFRDPCKPLLKKAVSAAHAHLSNVDETYGTHESRCLMSLGESEGVGLESVSLEELSAWVGRAIQSGDA